MKKRIEDLHGQIKLLQNREESLREKNDFLESILESSSGISIVSTDLNGNIIYWNKGAENIFGYKAEEIIGQSTNILYPDEETIKQVKMIRDELFSNNRGVTTTLREKTKSGKILWVNLTLTPRYDENNDLLGILGIGQDITALKKSQYQLTESVESLRKTLKGVIDAMMFTVETRDPYTAGHQRRVCELATAIAQEMNLDAKITEGISLAANIHDLGKISVPAEILTKPGKISEIEFNLIQLHPKVGYDILKSIEFPWPIAQIVLQHHERLDGKGYPNGLKNQEILLESKILSVADVVEAMASHRPYRPARGIDNAVNEILKFKNIRYDSDVVDACVSILKSGKVVLQDS